MAEHWTTDDIPDLTGRVAVVTGANSGLGFETARALAAHGASVTMTVRSLDKGRTAIDEIRADQPDADLTLQQLDLASLDSIRVAANELRGNRERIDLLVNNAGVMYTPYQQTADGFEMQFGTNHLGHFAWTGLIIDRLLAADASRIVTVSSVGHRLRSKIDFDDLHAERGYNRVSAYGRSKLANLLFTYELKRRLSQAGSSTIALAAHPGVSDTELGRHLPGERFLRPVTRLITQSATRGALPALRAATDPGVAGGQYYGPDGFMETRGHPVVVTSSDRSHELETQERLWQASEQLTDVTFPV